MFKDDFVPERLFVFCCFYNRIGYDIVISAGFQNVWYIVPVTASHDNARWFYNFYSLKTDNGGGMTPDKMRQCVSLGYSAKSKMTNTIGQCEFLLLTGKCYNCDYKSFLCSIDWGPNWLLHINICILTSDGNGFKTSTMRLGADVIVFSCCKGNNGNRLFH